MPSRQRLTNHNGQVKPCAQGPLHEILIGNDLPVGGHILVVIEESHHIRYHSIVKEYLSKSVIPG